MAQLRVKIELGLIPSSKLFEYFYGEIAKAPSKSIESFLNEPSEVEKAFDKKPYDYDLHVPDGI